MTYLIEGPLWYLSMIVFCAGVTWRMAAIFLRGRKADFSVARAPTAPGALKTLFNRFAPHPEMRPRIRLQLVAGYLFHLGLFALLLFAAPHVAFLERELLGFGWTPMPHWAFIVASQLAFFGLIMLWLRRLLNPVSRLLSTFDDHAASILTFAVMLTGCLALLQGFEVLRLTHRFSVELWLLYFPFSSLMHAFAFVPSRMFTGAWFGRRGVDA